MSDEELYAISSDVDAIDEDAAWCDGEDLDPIEDDEWEDD